LKRPTSVLIDKSVTFLPTLEREAGMAKGRAVAIVLDDEEKRELTALARKHGAPQALAERARFVLAASSGLNNKEVAAKINVCAATVGTWRNRALLRAADRARLETRRVPLGRRTRKSDQGLYRGTQCRPQTVPLDQDRRRHPGTHPTL